jgi:hypothetical protein
LILAHGSIGDDGEHFDGRGLADVMDLGDTDTSDYDDRLLSPAELRRMRFQQESVQ